jgi:GNAT superfamily N-acetyltransferase
MVTHELRTSAWYKFSIRKEGVGEVARASLFLITNQLHHDPYGLLEDVYVEKSYRDQGYGTELIHSVIHKAKVARCYKLIATSRFEREKVHALYERLGFLRHGLEFRMDFEQEL